jgi:hypothetical protein
MRLLDRPVFTLLGCSTLFALVLASSVALADGVAPNDATPAQRKDATDQFAAGKKAFEEKSWDKAVADFRASLAVINSPNARLELARTLRDSGQLGDAWTEYGRVIQDATVLAAKEERYAKTSDAATTERADVEAKLAFVTVTIAHAPAGATLKVGGRVIPPEQWPAPIVASVGAVDVVLTDTAGKELARQTVAATAGQKTPVALDAQPPVARPVDSSPDDKPDFNKTQDNTPPPTTGRSNLRTYSYIAGGVGVAGLAVFTIFGVMSNSDYNDLQSSCRSNVCAPNKSGEISNGKTFETVANVGLVAGIVGVAAGATLFVLSLSGKSSSNSTGLVLSPGYVGLRGSL